MYPQENAFVRLDRLEIPSRLESLDESDHERPQVPDFHQGPDLEVHGCWGKRLGIIEEVVV